MEVDASNGICFHFYLKTKSTAYIVGDYWNNSLVISIIPGANQMKTLIATLIMEHLSLNVG